MKKMIFLLLAVIFILCACNSEIDESSITSDSVSTESTISSENSSSSENSATEESRNESVIIESSLPETSGETSHTSSPSDDKDEQDGLIICGVPVTERNMNDVLGDGTVSVRYIEREHSYEVTLTDAELDASSGLTPDTVSESYMGIYCDTDLTVYLSGENRIYIPNPNADYFHCFGIYIRGEKLTIAGNGTLDIVSERNMNCLEVYGISAYIINIRSDISIDLDGGNKACGISGDYAELTAEYSDVKISATSKGKGCAAQGTDVFDITLVDATLDIYGDDESDYAAHRDSFFRDSYSSQYLSAPDLTLCGKSEVILRGSASVCYNNHFYLGESDFIPDIYCGSTEKDAKRTSAVYETVPDAFGKKYIKIASKSKDEYYLFVGGKAVTEKNADDIFDDGTASFDYETKTLHLNNADIKGMTAVNADEKVDYAIYSGMPLNIRLSGKSNVKTEGKDRSVVESVAIYAPKINVFGDGSLYVTSGASDGEGVAYSIAIASSTTYTQYGGRVTAISADADKSGYGESNGIRTFGDITVHGGYLYCESGNAAWDDPVDPSTHEDQNILVYPSDAEFEEGKTEEGNRYTKISTEDCVYPLVPDIYERMDEIEKAFAEEMDTVSATAEMVYTIKKYADMYDEIAEEYYFKLLSVGADDDWDFENNRYTPEEFYEFIRELKANWEKYFATEMDIYSDILAVQYQGGTITSVIFADHYYELTRDWAETLVNIYYW